VGWARGSVRVGPWPSRGGDPVGLTHREALGAAGGDRAESSF